VCAQRSAHDGGAPSDSRYWYPVQVEGMLVDLPRLMGTAYAAGALRLELATSPKSLYINGPPHAESAPLRAAAEAMPPWTALAATISFQSIWRFP
jgi:hypothetical protein